MNNKRLDVLIKHVDPKVQGQPGDWLIKYEGYEARVLTDEKADRMRIIIGAGHAKELNRDALYRLMQANFDSALDARYSIANEIVWSVFIHPLSVLTDKEFLSGLAQTINLTSSYGTTFSSGALRFRGGDSEADEQRRYQELLEKGELI